MTVVEVEAQRAADIIGVTPLDLSRFLREGAASKFERLAKEVRDRRFHSSEFQDLFDEGLRLLESAEACESAYDRSLEPEEEPA